MVEVAPEAASSSRVIECNSYFFGSYLVLISIVLINMNLLVIFLFL
jgi:hypothetical protein